MHLIFITVFSFRVLKQTTYSSTLKHCCIYIQQFGIGIFATNSVGAEPAAANIISKAPCNRSNSSVISISNFTVVCKSPNNFLISDEYVSITSQYASIIKNIVTHTGLYILHSFTSNTNIMLLTNHTVRYFR